MRKTPLLLASSFVATLVVAKEPPKFWLPSKPALIKNLKEINQHPFIAMPLTLGMLAGKVLPFTVEYLGAIAWSSANTISGSIDIGAVDATKEIFITSANRGSPVRTLTAATSTVDGVAVTKCTTEVTSTLNAVAAAFVATPTQSGSVTITVTYSGNLSSGSIAVYKILNRPGIGTNQTDASSATGTSTSGAVSGTTINANGLWLGTKFHSNANASTPPTGTTQNSDLSNGTRRISHCSRIIQVASSTPTDTWSWTTSAEFTIASWAFA